MELKEFSYKSCVYCIENTKTGRVYVGQTSQYPTRISAHLDELRRHRHKTPEFQADFDQYGEDVYIVYVLEECEKEALGEREFYHMEKFKERMMNKFMKNGGHKQPLVGT